MGMIIISGSNAMSNARERFEAYEKGQPVPPRAGRAKPLTPEEAEPFLDALAQTVAKELIQATWKELHR